MYLELLISATLPHNIKYFKFLIMADPPPKAFASSTRSTFALIDPTTSKLHRKIDRHGFLTSGLRTHVAISYVWSEWRENPNDKLPSWPALQTRLSRLFGTDASREIQKLTGKASRCWLDCMCIDQDNPLDKAYWIPRMDEVYYEARCTMLLLRTPSLDLNPLLKAKQQMYCPLSGPLKLKDIAQMVPHSCLLCQSCTSMSTLDQELEDVVVESIRMLCNATWRKRAWIVQEILLSQEYILTWDDSGEWISLSDSGVIAAVLFRHRPHDLWLGEFASWCRMLWFLRQNYDEAQTFELCDANVLQLASGLEATVPSDKYYALCGILRLKHVVPNPSHSADEALETIVTALIERGRMSWLYAMPPVLQDSFQLRDGYMAPFVLTRLESRFMPNKQHNAAREHNSICFEAVALGVITEVLPLAEVLGTTFTYLRNTRDFGFSGTISCCYRVPDIIRRLSLDVIDPLLEEPTFSRICRALGPLKTVESTSRKCWLCVMFLAFIDEALIAELCADAAKEDEQIVRTAASSLQQHLAMIQASFSVLLWTVGTDRRMSIAVGLSGCPVGANISSVSGEPDMMFAMRQSPLENGCDEFCGPAFSLNVRESIGPRPSTLFTTAFWRKKPRVPDAQRLRFRRG
jgi:hypothetical protein